jgi:hypothetical protein
MEGIELNLLNKKRKKRIREEKRKNMGFISKEDKLKMTENNINPKTNLPIKKTCFSPENIIKKILRINIRQINKLLNDNIIEKERYNNLAKLLAINNNANNILYNNKDEAFKQLEENNENNSITKVTVDNYEKIVKMTIKEILETLNTSKIYRNYFPFHNVILMNLILKNQNEYKINKLLNLTFAHLLLYYQYSPLFNDKKNNKNENNDNIIYYNKKIENIENEKYKEIIDLKNEIKDINFEGIDSLKDSIINLQNKNKYNEEYINKYINLALGYHEFFLDRKRKRIITQKSKVINSEDSNNESFSTDQNQINEFNKNYYNE